MKEQIIEKFKNKFVQYTKLEKTWLKNHTTFLLENASPSERAWYIINNKHEQVFCLECNKVPVHFCRRTKKLRIFCSRTCANKSKYRINNLSKTWKNKSHKELNDIELKKKKTLYDRYGIDNYNNRKKYKETNLKKFGAEHNWAKNISRTKAKLTCLKKYGNKNYNNIGQIKKTNLSHYHKRFLEISKNIHDNRYKYFELKQSHDLIDIECPIHGIFQLPMYYHTNGVGCRQCFPKNIGFSQKAIEWLEYISKTENIYIRHAMNGGEHRISGTKYHVDGYCKETNTCYEFLGDFWHGNPDIFEEIEINRALNKTHGECHQQTMNRLKEIRNLGYNVEYIWENHFKMDDNKQ